MLPWYSIYTGAMLPWYSILVLCSHGIVYWCYAAMAAGAMLPWLLVLCMTQYLYSHVHIDLITFSSLNQLVSCSSLWEASLLMKLPYYSVHLSW